MSVLNKNEVLFDVVAINLENHTVRVFYRNKDERNADAIINMAVIRRGVEKEFYVKTTPFQYNDGDKYTGK